MKLNDHFRNFLRNTVDLNKDRIAALEGNVEAIKNFVSLNYAPKVLSYEAHGSWAHKTIIKPVSNRPFDADILVDIEPHDGWDAADYILELRRIFRSSDIYKDKVEMSSHCVTLTYYGNRKIDIAPCLVNRTGWVQREVCNRHSCSFEITNPTAYTNWLIERNEITRGNSFRKVTRLVKYLRDIKGTFTCPSVLLTTLLGQVVYDWDDKNTFKDTPTTLKVIFNRLNDFLQSHHLRPTVSNPSQPNEDLAALISQEQYSNLRDTVERYNTWINDAYSADTRDESVHRWRKVFGEDFANSVVLEEGRSVGKKALIALAKSSTSLGTDLVALVKQLGHKALPPGFNFLPYKQEPEWDHADSRFASQIVATLHRTEQAPALCDVRSLDAVPKGHGLWFDVIDGRGQMIPLSEYRVQWRITNTDEEAFDASCMRGEFNPPKVGNRRWEGLTYRGVHIVEAFVIRRQDDKIISESDPFYVTIE